MPLAVFTLECAGKKKTIISDAALKASIKSWHMKIRTQNVTVEGWSELGLQPAVKSVSNSHCVEPRDMVSSMDL